MTNNEKEKILSEYGFTITSWNPFEIEGPTGNVLMGATAENIVDRCIDDWIAVRTDEFEDRPAEDTEYVMVREFHEKFGFLRSDKPTMVTKRKLTERAECMQEELDEFKLAIQSQDFAEQADALIDLVYFAKGTAVMMGLPWTELFADVQRANISKVRGVTKRGHAFDVIKPEGWEKPKGEEILARYGFDKSNFTTDGVVDEAKCADEDGVK